ncbi:hypothetical protein LZ554_005295 [Drepanopeziza brunnea f. sp. 'monogermtubi']|nr:hypothetical protein LZ554_005295 [Drepanopeziza brunnea f. sp. 'monogermtubi']
MPRTRRSASWYDCVFVPNRVPEPDRRVANLAHLDAKLAEERTATVPGDRKQIPEPKALALAPALSKEKPLPTEKPLPPLPVGPAKEEEEEEEEGDEEGKEGKWEGEDGDDDGDGDGDGDWNGSLAASSESDEVVVFGIATAVSVTRVRAKLVDILPRKAARGC